MPEYVVMKVTVEVEFTIRGSAGYSDAIAQALKPLEALEGAKVVAARAERQ
jgi:hypothetical protein